MSKLPPIILPIETKVRELDGKLFFAYHAAREGFDVYTGDQARMWNYVDVFPHGIYIDKSVAATRSEWFLKLRSWGNHVVSWDEEGLLFFNSDMYKRLRLDKDALDAVDSFFCWGSVQEGVIQSFQPGISPKLHICGNPRFDLMREDHKDFYAPRVRAIKEKYGNILLINTNFAFWNHFKTEKELREMLQSYPLASEEGYIDGWVEYQRNGFETFTGLIPELSEKYPDYTIIVRPHPSENFKPYQTVAEKCANVVVNAEGNVHDWIMAAELLLHDNCTTAVEAYVLGVPAISYRTFTDKRYENKLPKALSYIVDTKRALFRALELAVERDSNFHEKIWNAGNDEILKSYISGLEGATSVEKMVGMLKKSYEQSGVTDTKIQSIEKFLKIQWRKILHSYREVKTPEDGYMRQKFPGIDSNEIQEAFLNFDRINNTETCFSIKRITRDIYRIRCC